MVTILSTLWEEIFATPAVVEKVVGEKLVIKFRYTDFKTALFIDAVWPKLRAKYQKLADARKPRRRRRSK